MFPGSLNSTLVLNSSFTAWCTHTNKHTHTDTHTDTHKQTNTHKHTIVIVVLYLFVLYLSVLYPSVSSHTACEPPLFDPGSARRAVAASLNLTGMPVQALPDNMQQGTFKL